METMAVCNLMLLRVSVLLLGSCQMLLVGCQAQQSALISLSSSPIVRQASQPRYTTIHSSVFAQAALGVDPVLFDPLGKRNPGLKNEIFVPISSVPGSPGTVELNDFIGRAVQDVSCYPISLSSMRTLSNYSSYRDAMRESVSFRSGELAVVGSRLVCDSSSNINDSSSNDEEKNLPKFFSDGGEIVLGEAQCQTHVVSVNLNVKPIFTEKFNCGLRKISIAAKDPLSEPSQNIFFNFVNDFGTHFQDITFFGSRLVIMKLFVKKAANTSENTERHRCVSSSFTQNLGINSVFDETEQHFSRAASRCSDSEQAPDVLDSLGLSPTRVLTVGTVPRPDQDGAQHRPVPIHYKLGKISSMFTQDWFDSLNKNFNGTTMVEFFEYMSSLYENASLGNSCSAATEIECGNNSNCKLEEKHLHDNSATNGFSCRMCEIIICPDNEFCVDDDSVEGYTCSRCPVPNACAPGEACYAEPHSRQGYICVSTKPGRAVIAGGYRTGNMRYQTVEQVNYKDFPPMPAPASDGAMALSGGFIYTCCGYDTRGLKTTNCHRINASYPDKGWEAIPPAPTDMTGHSAVAIGSSLIWFIDRTFLLEFDSNTGRFSKVPLDFRAREYHCSVTNGTHAYVIGAGTDQNQIWVNEGAENGSKWLQVSNLNQSRSNHACLWYGSNIMITGGNNRADVEIFNTETGEVWQGKDLLHERQNHKMMLLNGMPTVVGGFHGDLNFDSFESFSLESNLWIKQKINMAEARSHFTLVQV